MPYARPEDRLAAQRRYNASPKGKETRHRYYLSKKPGRVFPNNPAPLAQVIKEWMQ